MWKSWGEQSKKEGGEAKDGKVTSPPGGASGQRVGEMNKERVSGGFLDIKVRGAVRSQDPGKGWLRKSMHYSVFVNASRASELG